MSEPQAQRASPNNGQHLVIFCRAKLLAPHGSCQSPPLPNNLFSIVAPAAAPRAPPATAKSATASSNANDADGEESDGEGFNWAACPAIAPAPAPAPAAEDQEPEPAVRLSFSLDRTPAIWFAYPPHLKAGDGRISKVST